MRTSTLAFGYCMVPILHGRVENEKEQEEPRLDRFRNTPEDFSPGQLP